MPYLTTWPGLTLPDMPLSILVTIRTKMGRHYLVHLEFERFRDELTNFAAELAPQLIVRDDEGATKFVPVTAKMRQHTTMHTVSHLPFPPPPSSNVLSKVAFSPQPAQCRSLAPFIRPPSASFVPTDGSEVLRLLVNGESILMDENRAKEIVSKEDVEIVVDLGMGSETSKINCTATTAFNAVDEDTGVAQLETHQTSRVLLNFLPISSHIADTSIRHSRKR
ncbi:hypothetical protein M422DRAFT_251108 [Sphaerobolus stellatus SS14]|uniref:Unplaced genomic scaffold SPHSTscaffold_37, whole genome shotgun sequence n=1 Tax=Sphaerobolus stellatus (strain SS14) TaxID=990650 RepID=A0A0C9W2S1_SPHS4|nr:hypothetical protein M422DRAFT_251108 [Sphaerobolus stellatus SS14]